MSSAARSRWPAASPLPSPRAIGAASRTTCSAACRSRITPAYGFVPADAAAWTVLATAPNGNGTSRIPYLLARPYGSGMIVLGGDDIRLSPAKMLENFVRLRDAGPPATP